MVTNFDPAFMRSQVKTIFTLVFKVYSQNPKVTKQTGFKAAQYIHSKQTNVNDQYSDCSYFGGSEPDLFNWYIHLR